MLRSYSLRVVFDAPSNNLLRSSPTMFRTMCVAAVAVEDVDVKETILTSGIMGRNPCPLHSFFSFGLKLRFFRNLNRQKGMLMAPSCIPCWKQLPTCCWLAIAVCWFEYFLLLSTLFLPACYARFHIYSMFRRTPPLLVDVIRVWL